MTREDIKNLIRQVINDMTKDLDMETNENNISANIGGFDAPFGSKLKRTMNKYGKFDDEDN